MFKTYIVSKHFSIKAVTFFLCSFCLFSYAQDPIKYEIEAQTIGTTNDVVPFWLRSNQFGSIPLPGVSQSFIGRAKKDYNFDLNTDSVSGKKKLIDWGFGFEGRVNIGKGSNIQIIEAYGKLKIGAFQLKMGRSKDVMGLNGDTSLSSGNFAMSGNALGIPKIEFSIPVYHTLPILSSLFAIKGNFAHGWVGRVPVSDTSKRIHSFKFAKTFLHQKSFYLRLGKPEWKIKLHGGFNHQVYWGDESKTFGSDFILSEAQTFFYAISGKTFGNGLLPKSKVGNQLGSIDVALEYKTKNINFMIYRQNIYDTGALSKLANIRDGLNGLSLENIKDRKGYNTFEWKKIVIELLYTKDQAGYPWSTPTNSGDEDYYNNYLYKQGWSYKELGLGNPLITPAHNTKSGQTSFSGDYFINNRVIALHTGIEGMVYNWDFQMKLSYSKNYGTFSTSRYGKSTGNNWNDWIPNTEVFTKVNQFSMYMETGKSVNKSTDVTFGIAFDQGKLLNNSSSYFLKVRKSF
jgi:hypothetical protein